MLPSDLICVVFFLRYHHNSGGMPFHFLTKFVIFKGDVPSCAWKEVVALYPHNNTSFAFACLFIIFDVGTLYFHLNCSILSCIHKQIPCKLVWIWCWSHSYLGVSFLCEISFCIIWLHLVWFPCASFFIIFVIKISCILLVIVFNLLHITFTLKCKLILWGLFKPCATTIAMEASSQCINLALAPKLGIFLALGVGKGARQENVV